MSSAPAGFSALLRQTIGTCVRLWKPVIFGGLLFFALMVPMFLFAFALKKYGEEPPPWIVGAGIFFSLYNIVISYTSKIYFLVLAVGRHATVRAAFRGISGALLWDFLIVGIYVFLRSYAWIGAIGLLFLAAGVAAKFAPFMIAGLLLAPAGAVVALIRGPRFAFSHIILVKEREPSWACTTKSHARTRGYWGKVAGNGVLFGLILLACTLGASIVVSLLMASASLAVGAAAVATGALALTVIMGFSQSAANAFLLHLHDTIQAHPRKK